MPRMSHHFVTDRPIDAVFDVVTTARFWPEWHPVPEPWIPAIVTCSMIWSPSRAGWPTSPSTPRVASRHCGTCCWDSTRTSTSISPRP